MAKVYESVTKRRACTLVLYPNTVRPNGRVSAHGGGFEDKPVSLSIDDIALVPLRVFTGSQQKTGVVPENGEFLAQFALPDGLPPGKHIVHATVGELRADAVLEVLPQAPAGAPVRGDDQRGRMQYFVRRRFGPTPVAHKVSRVDAWSEVRAWRARAAAAAPAPPSLVSSNWTPVGASVVPNGQTLDNANRRAPISGRVTTIVLDPTDTANTIYAGTAQGGVWKSTDRGNTWLPQSDFTFSLAIGALAIDRSGGLNRIFAGTGEENFSGDSYYGGGLLQSDDGGSTWTQIGAAAFGREKVNRIIVDPANSKHLLVASTAGLMESTDTGATWTNVHAGTATDIAYDSTTDPANPRVYAAFWGDGIYLRIGAGTFNKITNPTLPLPQARISLGMAPGTPQTIYAAFGTNNATGSALQGVFVTTDGGTNWTAVSNPGSSNNTWYNLFLVVHPTNAQIVYLGEMRLWQSADGGSTWTDLTAGQPPPGAVGFHADQHALAIDPNSPTTVWSGNDGGVWLSTDGTTFTHRNRGLQTLQYETIAQNPTYGSVLLCGAQDNGIERYSGDPAWSLSDFGDGGCTAIDPNNQYRWYEGQAKVNSMGVNRSDDAGGTWTNKVSGINAADRALFYPPFVIDPSNTTTLYYGTFMLYRTTNGGDAWSAISGDLTKGGANDAISAIAVAPSDPNTVYAGTSDGNFWQLKFNGTTWTPTAGTGLPGLYISEIAVDPTNANNVYLTIGALQAGSGEFSIDHVWKSINGVSFTSASTGLPQTNPANCIVVDPASPTRLFVGFDVGLFRSEDSGTSWVEWDQGLPNVAVLDVELHNPTRLLRAATHGRSVWERPIDSTTPVAVDLYIRDNVGDIGRGPSPSGTADPFQSGATLTTTQSIDIRVDSPPYQTPGASIDYITFLGVNSANPIRGSTSRVFVQVNNRGVNVAASVQARAFWADGSHPQVPADFWTAFPNSDPSDTTVWHPIGPAQTITNLRPAEPQIVEWDWLVPGAPNSSCILAACTSADDPVNETGLDPNAFVASNKHIAIRDAQVDGTAPAAVVTGVNPNSGPAAGGTSVTITGTGFFGATGVGFGATGATQVSVPSDTQITATSPAGSGTVDVTVVTPVGTSATSAADQFTYSAAAGPSVTAINPASGPAAGGTSVVITGSGFTGANSVGFGATSGSAMNVDSDTQITATSPAGSGTVDVTVVTPAGTSATSAADQFTYTAAAGPSVTAINPANGPAAGGTSVVITGSGFTGANSVGFGATSASAMNVDSDTQITATSPAGSGTVDVTVVTPAGTSATSAADQFTYTAAAGPSVTAINPTSGTSAGGDSVVITGSGFTGATSVGFGATSASSMNIDSDTQITATSPAGSGTVDVTVITPAGTSATSAADQFTYM